MQAKFSFYDQYGHRFGMIECDDNSQQFRHLTASGYSYWQPGAREGLGHNKLDTRGQYEQLVADSAEKQ